MVKSLLIKDTTREEREKIVERALSCGGECDFCNACENRGGGRTEDFYKPYIDGEKELFELNREYKARLVR